MAIGLRGRQTQFYIDVVYGVAFAIGFGYLLFVGMDARVAAFQGGLILGYILRVWENMSIYERILEEEVAQEAETRVAEEIEEQVPSEAETQVAKEVEEQVGSGVEERVTTEAEAQVVEEAETELLDRLGEIDEELAAELRERLDERARS